MILCSSFPYACDSGSIQPLGAKGPSPQGALTFTYSVDNCNLPGEVLFDASLNKETTAVYTWDFGDGASAGGIKTSHTYAQRGPFTVKLTQSFGGTSRESQQILEGCALRGVISARTGSGTDVDVNDPGAPLGDNNSSATAQRLSNPVTLGGYASAVASGIAGDVFADKADEVDFYRVAVAQGQTATLTISDHQAAAPAANDLDLLLFAVGDSSEPIASSVDTTATEIIRFPQSGEFDLVVRARAGRSNYILTLAQSTQALQPRLRLEQDMQIDEVIIKYKNNTLKKNAVPAALSALTKKKSAPGGAMLLALPADEQHREIQLKSLRIKHPRRFSSRMARLKNRWQEKHRTVEFIKSLRAREDVEYAEPNYIRKPMLVPNDEYYPLQWHYPLINLPQAWDISTGTPANGQVVVAVVDTGVVLNHPELDGNLVPGFDFISSDRNAADNEPGIDANPNDPGDGINGVPSSFHGTHVAGTIAARTDNTTGVAGVAWGARIMPIRVLGKAGGNSFDIIQGLRFAAGLNNDSGTVPAQRADVINLSLGGPGFSRTEQALYLQLRDLGILVVASAGNSNNSELNYPAAYDGVFSVSAVDINENRAPYSSFGTTIDLAAPGGNINRDRNNDGYADGILSTLADDGNPPIPSLGFYQGTSMAAPHVSGVFALMKAVNPALKPADVEQLLSSGAITKDIAGNGATVRDDQFGYGLIDAFKAVEQAGSLAGGGVELPPVLGVSPSLLNFGTVDTQVQFTISNVGGGTLTITDVQDDAPWLSVGQLQVDAQKLGTYAVIAKRDGLETGIYSANITFTSAEAGSLKVPVTMQVGEIIGDGGYSAGHQLVFLIDADNGQIIDTVTAQRQQDHYTFQINNVPAGRYHVMASSDDDHDGAVCDPGEACGGFPTLGRLSTVEIPRDQALSIDFTTMYEAPVGRFNQTIPGLRLPVIPGAAVSIR